VNQHNQKDPDPHLPYDVQIKADRCLGTNLLRKGLCDEWEPDSQTGWTRAAAP
jgi:hypothetical protein